MSASPKTTVVYVLSSPHSGSTLLGTLLASHPSIHFGGELFEIPSPAWNLDHRCACGETATACPFWHQVRAAVEQRPSTGDGTDLAARFQRPPSLLRMRLGAWFPSRQTRRYSRSARELAESVAAASGRPFLVDSSHGPTRALAYNRARDAQFEVKFIHLVRDGRRVVASRKKSAARHGREGSGGPHSALGYAALWAGANLLFIAWFGMGRKRYARIRYEDLLRDPRGTLGRVGELLGLSLDACASLVVEERPFPVGHLLSGNRFRLNGQITVQRSPPPADDGLLPRERRSFALVAGIAARLFGYS